jgi:hypothetical protein
MVFNGVGVGAEIKLKKDHWFVPQSGKALKKKDKTRKI